MKVMGQLIQVECWEKHLTRHHLLCMIAKGKLIKEMEKTMEKDLKRKKYIIGILFMKIKENRRKGR